MADRPPSLLLSQSHPARPIPSSSHHSPSASNSPFRYVHLTTLGIDHPLAHYPSTSPTTTSPSSPSPLPPQKHSLYHSPSRHHQPLFPQPQPCPNRAHRPRIPDRLKPWLGVASWVATSIAFLLAVAFWKTEVFTALDQLSFYLQNQGVQGYAILFTLIFLTTIPPLPLYSTLIILSGYTYGSWIGALISYAAALSGAVIVFLLSRHYLRESMNRLLSHTLSLKRVVRAIEKRPSLLLLIRIAPYPYNLMNVLLASSHTLSFSTYFTCTAISLFKVLIHTTIGSGIHSFAGYHAVGPDALQDPANAQHGLGTLWTATGIFLCLAILVYLSLVARRAVDDELEDDGLARAEDGRGHLSEPAAEMREVGH